jgi:hypothetical protein
MPPDTGACVRKFIPNNTALASIVVKVCDSVFRARTLPLPLVKLMVDRAFDQARQGDDIKSAKFEYKLTEYANAIKPRFMAQIMDIRKRSKKW